MINEVNVKLMKKMQTKLVNFTKNPNIITQAIDILNNSGVIAFPTETVYGIGCDFSKDTTVKKIYQIKGRAFNKPLAAHIGDFEQIKLLSDEIPDLFYRLAEAFLPGPLSIIIKKKNSVSDSMTSGFETVAIRFPANKCAIKLIKTYGKPLAATSANISGNKSPVNADEVFEQLNGKIPLIIDDGETINKIDSTVISLVGPPKILRIGAIEPEEIESVIGLKLLR